MIFTAEGWEDEHFNRHYSQPDDLGDTYGVFVHAYDPDNEEEDHWFWVYVGDSFESWDEWWVYIGAMMEMHGIALG